jgi:flavin-dependent dehydrogenase
MKCDVDMLIVGGGPAGTAAAIHAAQSGLRTTLMERLTFPRDRPGETLHPGVQVLFRQLGVERQVAAESAIRHDSVVVEWGGKATTQMFGSDSDGHWRGYQIFRSRLDAILIERARQVGVCVLQPAGAVAALVEDGRVCGVRASIGTLRAGFVIDATGQSSWLTRQLKLEIRTASPPLRAIYGYYTCGAGTIGQSPRLIANAEGWTWTAEIQPGRVQFTHVPLFQSKRKKAILHLPSSLCAAEELRGADVTWRCVSSPAGPGYFIAGDAATVLDPSSSHGVLRALMSGMMASYATKRVLSEENSERVAAQQYNRWMENWFAHDVRSMSGMYQQLGHLWPRAS